MSRHKTTWKLCAGFHDGEGPRAPFTTPCPKKTRFPAVGRRKRCDACRVEQRRYVNAASGRKHWPKYRDRRKEAEPCPGGAPRAGLFALAAAIGLRAQDAPL